MDTLPHTTAPRGVSNSVRQSLTRRDLLRASLVGTALIRSTAMASARQARAPEPSSPILAPGPLFDGVSLGHWAPVEFGGQGEVRVENGQLRLERGNDLTGVVWTGALPPETYVIRLEAMRVEGSDFFCALTFPVAGSHCTFVVGGWGGGVIGLSSLESMDASENETSQGRRLENGRWYRIAVHVSPGRIRADLDDETVVDLNTRGRSIGVRPEMDLCRPLGLASYRTTAALRAIRHDAP